MGLTACRKCKQLSISCQCAALPRIKNSKGTVYYGMHFYPGVAEYKEPGGAFRVFLNEDTIRAMGPSFAGRPVFVLHVDEVQSDIDELRREADGWVIESFFNDADGKHWAKFLICSEKGQKAIDSGYRLSNCYMPNEFARGGEWNGVSYQKEVKGGEYEHLAIVPNPRYEESIIMTPDQFKAYNEQKKIELQRLANDKGGSTVALKFFTRKKVENSADIENVVVLLPKTGREVDIATLVNEADEAGAARGKPKVANALDTVKVVTGKDEKGQDVVEEMTVDALRNAYEAKCANEDDDVLENEDDDMTVENEAEDDKPEQPAPKKDKGEMANKKKNKKKNSTEGTERAKALRNAHTRGNHEDQTTRVYDPTSGVQRGKDRYGS